MNFSRFVVNWQRRILTRYELESPHQICLQCRKYVDSTQGNYQLASSQERIVSSVPSKKVKVGVVFDIDGVLAVSYTHLTLPTICSV